MRVHTSVHARVFFIFKHRYSFMNIHLFTLNKNSKGVTRKHTSKGIMRTHTMRTHTSKGVTRTHTHSLAIFVACE